MYSHVSVQISIRLIIKESESDWCHFTAWIPTRQWTRQPLIWFMNISPVSKYLSEESKYESPKAAIKKQTLTTALIDYEMQIEITVVITEM